MAAHRSAGKLFIRISGFERAECIRALDYDFIAADDLFANRSYVRGSYKSVPEKHMETPPIFTATDR